MDVVANLLSLVAEDPILAAFQVAFDEVAEEPVELDAGMGRPREASAPQAAGRHAEVTAILLHHHVGSHLRGSEERVLAGVNAERFRNAVGVCGVGVVPAGIQFDERDLVGRVAVHLVRAHVHERRFRNGPTRRFEEVERADGVGIKVVEGDGGSAVVRRLRGGMHDGIGLDVGHEPQDAIAVAQVEFVVREGPQRGGESFLIPAGVAGGAEEHGPLVVVDAVHPPAKVVEMPRYLAPDQA